MKKKWKVILLIVLMLPCIFLFNGCNCSADDTEDQLATYTVHFYTDSDESFNYPIQEVQRGKLLTRPTNPTKAGYSFLGWFTDTERINLWKFESDRVYSDMTLYAKWEKIIVN